MTPVDVAITGRVVLITGASSGIGRAAALAFAQRGAHLLITGRNEAALNALHAQIQAMHNDSDVRVVVADLTHAVDIENLAAAALQHFGHVDVLINNAGMMVGGALVDASPPQMRTMIHLNLLAMMHLTNALLPSMLARQQGHIINVTSVAGAVLGAGQVPYAASKAGANGFTHALRRELAGTGVRVSLFMPGWTDTPLLNGVTGQDMGQARLANIFFPIRTSQAMADVLVSLVRRPRLQVIKGGLGFWFAMWMQRLSPALMDVIYRFYFDKPAMTQVFKTMTPDDDTH